MDNEYRASLHIHLNTQITITRVKKCNVELENVSPKWFKLFFTTFFFLKSTRAPNNPSVPKFF